MISLGMLLGKFITSNPRIVVMSTSKLEAGKPVEVEGIKLAKIGDEVVILLTI